MLIWSTSDSSANSTCGALLVQTSRHLPLWSGFWPGGQTTGASIMFLGLATDSSSNHSTGIILVQTSRHLPLWSGFCPGGQTTGASIMFCFWRSSPTTTTGISSHSSHTGRP
uniref:(northern house mosquito) hypothetical protein n=1 Tax=Culex pipiens TaxID=7175 RepID=A0A8D8A2P9_CULPI